MAERMATGVTLTLLEAIAKDTRLPGEIGCSYGYSAAVVLRLQSRGRQMLRERAAAVRRRLELEFKPEAPSEQL